MATYRTFIGDPLGCVPQALFFQIQSELAALFSACSGDSFENNWVFKASPSMLPMAWELLVYFVPAGVSIIKNVHGVKQIDLTVAGNTLHLAGASEVYMKTTSPLLLARVAFHELMHNRLKMGGDGPFEGLHTLGGLASWKTDFNTPYTDSNKRVMAAVIANPIKQWTAGLSINPQDPNSEYYNPQLSGNG